MKNTSICCLLLGIFIFSLIAHFYIVESFVGQEGEAVPMTQDGVNEIVGQQDETIVQSNQSPETQQNIIRPRMIRPIVQRQMNQYVQKNPQFKNEIEKQHYMLHEKMKRRAERNTV
jgi:hypothetical protein